jgi:predicted nucleic acid-binding protein
VKVVSNSGPLMALAKVGQIHLLTSLYEEILIPSAVYEETVANGLARGESDAISIQMAVTRQHLRVVKVDEQNFSEAVLALPLDRGERHAIELAIKENAECVLLDDMMARDAAQKLNLKVKGTLGVLVEAFRKGALSASEVDTVFDALLKRDDIWIADALIHRIWSQLKKGG